MYIGAQFNVYCDESCHLENDGEKSMVLGGVWCPSERVRDISERIRDIKQKHGLDKFFESKWTKVSPAKIDFYLELVAYFFDSRDLHFRGLVIPDKDILDHEKFSQSHDAWYYKMYFLMLKQVLNPNHNYNIYLDIKDTKSQQRIVKLHEILTQVVNSNIINKIQHVRSHEVEALQLTDLIIGALSYLHRGYDTSPAKLKVIESIQKRSKQSLMKTTILPKEDKFNILVWKGQDD